MDLPLKVENEEEAIDIILEAIERAGYIAGKDVCLAIDVAATEMYEEAQKIEKRRILFLEN